MYNGILVVNKEKGFTSHDVVGKLRGILKQKKIGHTGTLDPDAEGVLPVCLGNATKVCDLLTDRDKVYEAVIKLGLETTTQDMSGEVIGEYSTKGVTTEGLCEVIKGFLGEYQQVPPMYSALKVNGKKLYEYAREGIEVERKARTVFIHEISLLDWDGENMEGKLRVECSKGTYIRTLCYDIGKKLGCGGTMKYLLRTRAAGFSLEEAHKLCEIEREAGQKDVDKWVIPVDRVFSSCPMIRVKPEGEKFLMNGNLLQENLLQGELLQERGLQSNLFGECNKDGEGFAFDKGEGNYGKIGQSYGKYIRVYDSKGEFRAVYELRNGKYYPVKMFL